MFGQTFVQTEDSGRRASTILISFAAQVVILLLLVLVPLIYFDQLPGVQLTSMLTSPPPPAAPPIAKAVQRVKAVEQSNSRVLVMPARIPREVKMIQEEAPPPSAGITSVNGALPGGLPDGIPGGLSGVSVAPPPVAELPKKKAVPRSPERVGGVVMAASLLRQVRPVYPPLARQARISGTVEFNARISKDGRIQNLNLISGHPLLVKAAQDAVEQWMYKPTLLNGDPVEVLTTITVHFELSQ